MTQKNCVNCGLHRKKGGSLLCVDCSAALAKLTPEQAIDIGALWGVNSAYVQLTKPIFDKLKEK